MSDVKKCPHCGKQLHDNAQYCMFCMTSLQAKHDITPKIHCRKWWGIIVVLIFALGFLMLALFCGVRAGFFYRGEGAAEVAITSDTRTTVTQTTDTQIADTQPSSAQEELPTEFPDITVPSNSAVLPEENLVPTQPIITEPMPEQAPGSTEVPSINHTTPPATEGTICNHTYQGASCVAPRTCSRCGITVGTPDLQAHSWKPVTKVIHHDESGHYEDTEYRYKKTVYLCYFCGYNQAGYDSLEILRVHMEEHSAYLNYESIMARPDLLADTREVWATGITQQWVVDRQAYDETVITEYICTLCGEKKLP